MDGNLASCNLIPGASYGATDIQGSLQMPHYQNPNASFQQPSHCQHQGSMIHPPLHDDHYKQGERCKISTSDEEDDDYIESKSKTGKGFSCRNDAGGGTKGSPWQRMKWTKSMVRLLITAVSYLGEDGISDFDGSRRRKIAFVQKKGKWKLISKVLAERGFYVSPQQCEDKFNDLNKRYKRLTDILGRGTSCKVVENPALLDSMSHVPDKAKDYVRKILSSKHLFYEEMCSYHNGNRLNLPANPALLRSLQLAILSKDERAMNMAAYGDTDDDEEEGLDGTPHKKKKHGIDHEETASHSSPGCFQDFNRGADGLPVAMEAGHAAMEVLRSQSVQLDEQALLIQSQILDLEQQQFKWRRFSKRKDRELDKIRMENEKMKLENERLALDLKHKQLEIGLN